MTDSRSGVVQDMVAWLIAKPVPARRTALVAMTSLLAGPLRRAALARILAGALHHAEAFEAYAQGNARQTVTAGLKSIANSRQARHNRGLLAIIARSIVRPHMPKSLASGTQSAVSSGVGAQIDAEWLPATLREQIEQALGEPIVRIKALAGGFSGDSTCLVDSANERAILRLATAETYAAHVNGLRLTAKHELLAPRLLAANPPEAGGLVWLLQSIVPGHHFEELDFADEAHVTTILREVAAQMRRMHSMSIAGYGRLMNDDGTAQFATLEQWIDGWLHALEDWSRAGALPEESMPVIAHALAFLLDEVDNKPVWCHGDLSGRNLMVQDGHLTGIIDWDDACGCDPAWDVACMVNTLELCCTPERAGPYTEVLLDAYLDLTGGSGSFDVVCSQNMPFLRRVAAFRVIVNAWSLGVTKAFDDPYRKHIAEAATRILVGDSAADQAQTGVSRFEKILRNVRE